jgi:hypothetical protein
LPGGGGYPCSAAARPYSGKEFVIMDGPFLELADAEGGHALIVNTRNITWVGPRTRGGATISFLNTTESLDVEESPSEIAALLRTTGATFQKTPDAK